MKPSEVKATVRLSYESNIPMFLVGPPGIGKSSVIAQIADEMGIGMQDERMLQHDVVDVKGFPYVTDGIAKFTRPAYMPSEGKGILLLDELNAAPPLVQAACYQLILDRKLGEHVLAPGWLPIGAGNREIDRAVVSRMPSALANRFFHVEYEVDVDEWITWAIANAIRTELIAFIKFRPELLMDFDPKKSKKAFATPRSNAMLSALMDAGNGDISYELMQGVTGEGHAAEFMGFLKIFKSLPDPDAVLMAPKKAMVPDEPATMFALCGALASKASDQNFPRVVEYADRLAPEFSVLLIRDAIERVPELTQTRSFIEWSSKHSDVLS